jgi:hypothetical protein
MSAAGSILVSLGSRITIPLSYLRQTRGVNATREVVGADGALGGWPITATTPAMYAAALFVVRKTLAFALASSLLPAVGAI